MPSHLSISSRSSVSTSTFKAPNQSASTVKDIALPTEPCACATVSSSSEVPAGISQAYLTSTTKEQTLTVSNERKEGRRRSTPKTFSITNYNVHKPLASSASLVKADSMMEETQPSEGRSVSETKISREEGTSNHVLSMDIPARNEYSGHLDFSLKTDHGFSNEVVCNNTDVRTKPPISTETQPIANFHELLERNITSSIELLDKALNNIEESSSSPSKRANENKGNLEGNSTSVQNRNFSFNGEVTGNSLVNSMGGSPIKKIAQDAQLLTQPSFPESGLENLFENQESSGSIIGTNISANELYSATKLTKGTAMAFPCLPSSYHRVKEEIFTSTVVLESLQTPDMLPEAGSNDKKEIKLQNHAIFQECFDILDPAIPGTKKSGIEHAPNTPLISIESDTQTVNGNSSGNTDVLIHMQIDAYVSPCVSSLATETQTATDASDASLENCNQNHQVSQISGDTLRSVEPKVSPGTSCSQGYDVINEAFLTRPFTDESHHVAVANSSYTAKCTPLSGQELCDAVPQNEKEVFQSFSLAMDKHNVNERYENEGSTCYGDSSDLHAAPKRRKIETNSIACLEMDTQPTMTPASLDLRSVSDQMLEITQAMNDEFFEVAANQMDTQNPTDNDGVLDCTCASDYEMEDSMEEQGQNDSRNNSIVLEMPSAVSCATSVVIGPQNVQEAGMSFECTDSLICRPVANLSDKGAASCVIKDFFEGSRRTKRSTCLEITDNPKTEMSNTTSVNTEKILSNSAFTTEEQNETQSDECFDVDGVSVENLLKLTPTGRNEVLSFTADTSDRHAHRVSDKLKNSVVNTDQEMEIADQGYSDKDSPTIQEAETSEPEYTEGINIEGLNIKGLNTDSRKSKGLNNEGYNTEGLNNDGFNNKGLSTESLNTEGLNTDGVNIEGLSTEGLNIEGLSSESLNTEGLNTDGFNIKGLSTESLNTEGLNTGGLNIEDLSTEGLNIEGLSTEGLNIEDLNIDVAKMVTEKQKDITSATPLNVVCTSSNKDIMTEKVFLPEESFQCTGSASPQEMIDTGAHGQDDVIPVEGVFECASVVGPDLKDAMQDISSRDPDMKVKHITGQVDYCGRLPYEIRDVHTESIKAPPSVIPEAKKVPQTMGEDASLEHGATSAHTIPDTAQEVIKQGRKICLPTIVLDTVAASPERQPLQHVGCFDGELCGTVNNYMIESSNVALGVLAVVNPHELIECSEYLANEEGTNEPNVVNEESQILPHCNALQTNNKLNPVESHGFGHEMHVTAPLKPQALMNNSTMGSVRSTSDELFGKDCNVPRETNVAERDTHFECCSSPAISDDLAIYEVAEVDDKHVFTKQVCFALYI